MIRKSLITKVGVRKIFTAIFVSYGTAKTNEGEHATALLHDVKDHGKVCTDHAWVKATPEFKELKKGDKIMFRARVEMYPKSHHNIKWDVGLTQLTKVKRCEWG
jgi:hypothetical protein